MRLMKMFGLAALAAVAAMAFVGATSASAEKPTVLCKEHGQVDGVLLANKTQLLCPKGQEAENVIVHAQLKAGTIGKLLSPISVLCLNVLTLAEALKLAQPLQVHTKALEFSGCGTGSAHNNCTVTPEGALPLNTLLKTGLDEGSLEATNGSTRLKCANLGIDCLYDLEGSLFSAGGGHLIANETPTTELGGKFFCPDEGFLDGDLEELAPRLYILE